MEPVTVNVNRQVKVILTHYGLRIAAHHPYFTLTQYNFVVGTNELTVPLWELMFVFGEHHRMGCLEIPFQRNEILFTGKY